MTDAAIDWGPALTDEDVELLASPTAEIINPKITHLWVALYMTNGCSIPMTMTSQDRDEVIKWVRSNSSLDRTQPIKLYRLEY